MLLVFAVQATNAQVYDIEIPSNVVLTDNQWHTDGYSIVEANDNVYLVLTPSGYSYYTLPPFDVAAFEAMSGDIVRSYRPYYNHTLGWYVKGRRYSYFYHAGGYNVISAPVYYNYHYQFGYVRSLNLRNYYWYIPNYRIRPLRHWHEYRRPPAHNRPPKHSGRSDVGQNRPPQNNGTQTRPPQQNQSRQSGRSSAGQNRSSQSRGTQSGSRAGSSRSSGQGGGSASRGSSSSSSRRR